MYKSNFSPSELVIETLRGGHIMDEGESPSQMIERVVDTVFSVEDVWGVSATNTDYFRDRFGNMCDDGDVVLSTPILTNAGRYKQKPLTACTMPPVDLRQDLSLAKQTIDTLHQQGMGTGFNLSDTEDPVGVLDYLNQIAVDGYYSGNEDRPVGNMAILSVRHPKIIDFINAKRGSIQSNKNWKFNISVDIDDGFMNELMADGKIILTDGSTARAADIFEHICEAARECADPGLVFMDRMNLRNPTPGLGKYETTAPCAEVGLAPGETCQFGYINVGNFVKYNEHGVPYIDFDKLTDTTQVLTRVLDNCLELSLDHYTVPGSNSIMVAKRKIGVGACGIADMLINMNMSYDSTKSVEIVKEVISWINYQSKIASIALANDRGSCNAMGFQNLDTLVPMNRHLEDPSLIEKLFVQIETGQVSGDMWRKLAVQIRNNRILRNVTTTALPPTGRSGPLIDASTGIEPLFSLSSADGSLVKSVGGLLRRHGIEPTQFESRDCETNESGLIVICKTATQIPALGHLAMAAGAQEVIDEAVSKTVNMPADATVNDVREIYTQAWESGMSGITIYLEGTHSEQPMQLGDRYGTI